MNVKLCEYSKSIKNVTGSDSVVYVLQNNLLNLIGLLQNQSTLIFVG